MASPSTSVSPPPAGTFIDDGALELVSILGYGGYGIVYRAIDHRTGASYAVKCLIHSQMRTTSRQRRLHLQEITLHQLASSHPHVVSLHRVIEEDGYTFIVMDYCPDGDLFSQILHHRRYLGHDGLIKHVFLQLLDAVGYCHSLGIYHRDLKPENVLCFSGGLRLALTDFGLATTDRVSDEFRTGSVYHMSPECQGGDFAPAGTYSPPYNDIWSLGIILLNLITGRNPWKSASASDPTFQAYLQDPTNFLPSVLPISEEVNDILLQTLDVNWRSRITLAELRHAIKGVRSFYAEDVVFEGSMARCAWEAGIDINGDAEPEEEPDASSGDANADVEFKSAWSEDSSPDMVFAKHSSDEEDASSWTLYPPSGATWGEDSVLRSRTPSMLSTRADDPTTPLSTTFSVYSPALSDPYLSTRPEDGSTVAHGSNARSSPMLSIDPFAKCDASIVMRSTNSSAMHTALESPGIVSSFFIPSPVSVSKPSFAMSSAFEVKMSTYAGDEEDRQESMSWAQTSYDRPTDSTSATRDLSNMEFSQPASEADVSPLDSPVEKKPWRDCHSMPNSPQSALFTFPIAPLVSSPASSTPYKSPISPTSNLRGERPKHRSSNFFLPIRFAFPPRSSPPAPVVPPIPCPGPAPSCPLPPLPSMATRAAENNPTSSMKVHHSSNEHHAGEPRRRRRLPLRSARNWLFLGKRLTATAA